MKSVVIQQPNALEIEERPLPLPGAGDVRVKIKLAGICRFRQPYLSRA